MSESRRIEGIDVARGVAVDSAGDYIVVGELSVQGEDQHPLYTYLTSEATNPEHAGDITWNFEKFLLDREGNVVARFAPRTRPDAPEVVAAIEAELERAQ